MRCPKCQGKMRIVDSRGKRIVYRRRVCVNCKNVIITEEKPAAEQEEARRLMNLSARMGF